MSVETPAYAAMMRRMIRAYGQRVGAADPEDLAEMIEVREVFDDAIAAAVGGLRDQGHSWAAVGRGLGTSRQAAQMTYGRRRAG